MFIFIYPLIKIFNPHKSYTNFIILRIRNYMKKRGIKLKQTFLKYTRMNQTKIYIRNFILLLFSIIIVSCSQEKEVLKNPYADDYSNVKKLSQKELWGAGNTHDPSILKTDSFYYVYSTDAYYMDNGTSIFDTDEKVGNILVRRSKDLINWEFIGWALDTIPKQAVEYIHGINDNIGAESVWAPYILKYNDIFRLYYSVSTFGYNISYIGFAESNSPEGPWVDKGEVVKTNKNSPMNAIDPSIVIDAENGKMWMHYGSYFGGLYCVELNPETGKTLKDGDLGHLIATRGDAKDKIIEAPEIIYNPELKKYFLFVSYEPLFTYYNIRVGQSDKPEGSFYDYFGNNMADTTNNYPILTHSYMFDNHPGWSGNGHCAVFNDNGQYYMLHQGRLAPNNLLINLQVREIKWLSSGWPVVSPERLAHKENLKVNNKTIAGEWEIINLKDLKEQTQLWQGQIPPGGWTYDRSAFNTSTVISLKNDGTIENCHFTKWELKGDKIYFDNVECAVFDGWDWENERATILISGILDNGTSIWAKKLDNKQK